jgi:hypothetical protein
LIGFLHVVVVEKLLHEQAAAREREWEEGVEEGPRQFK